MPLPYYRNVRKAIRFLVCSELGVPFRGTALPAQEEAPGGDLCQGSGLRPQPGRAGLWAVLTRGLSTPGPLLALLAFRTAAKEKTRPRQRLLSPGPAVQTLVSRQPPPGGWTLKEGPGASGQHTGNSAPPASWPWEALGAVARSGRCGQRAGQRGQWRVRRERGCSK